MDKNQFWRKLEVEHERAEAFCRRLAGNRHEGDDLYQDALLTAWTNVRTLRDPNAFRPWLYRIMVNTFRNRLRGPWWRRRVALTPEMLENRRNDDPTESYTARRWLDRAMAVLNPEDRALITLFELEGWTIAELATLQRKPEGTIKARLARARTKMRRAIEQHSSNVSAATQPNNHEAEYALPQSEPTAE